MKERPRKYISLIYAHIRSTGFFIGVSVKYSSFTEVDKVPTSKLGT